MKFPDSAPASSQDDAALLRGYVEAGSEEAFTELVQRHISLVYHAALRRTAHPQLAEDATQHVFIALARNAAAISRHAVLPGWLHTTTRFAANNVMRAERRRQLRDQEIYAMQSPISTPSADWEQLRPAIDDVIDELSERDRAAVLLRYFEGRSFAHVGAALQLTEDAARKRVARGIDRMRSQLAKRGITSTSAALALMLSSQAALAAPAGLAATIIHPAMAAGAKALSLSAARVARIATGTKTALGIAALVGAAALLGIPAAHLAFREAAANRQVRNELAASRSELETETAQMRRLEQKAQESERNLAGRKARVLRAATAGAPDPRAEGRKFLQAFPQARSLLRRAASPGISKAFSPFFRSANLTPGRAGRFEDLLASTWIGNLSVTPSEMGAGAGEPSDEQLNQVLGEEGTLEYKAYRRTLRYPYQFTATAAAVARELGTPLTDQQIDQVAQVIAKNSGPFEMVPGMPGDHNSEAAKAAVNWDEAIAQAKAVLTPGQFSAVQAAFLGMQLNQALVQAMRGRAQSQDLPSSIP